MTEIKIQIPEEIYNQNDEFFRYTMSIQEYEKLDLSAYDMVMATQPPSFAVNHPNVVVLFYHHLKIFYDMYEDCVPGYTNRTSVERRILL